MYKYEGLLVYQAHDDDGIIEIVERDGVRSLHFGSYSKQSSMRLNKPNDLELDYVRAMTSYLLFKPQLKDDALIIGLGGGCLTKFLLWHFPDSRLTVIEYRKSVVKIARSHFGLPLDTRLNIHIADAALYLQKHYNEYLENYSLVIIDAFDADGMAESLCYKEFFEHCRAVLKKDGMLIINLWGDINNPLFIKISTWLGEVFSWHTLFLPVQSRGNIIVLAFNYKPAFNHEKLKRHAELLAIYYDIDFPAFLKDIKEYNTSTFNHFSL